MPLADPAVRAHAEGQVTCVAGRRSAHDGVLTAGKYVDWGVVSMSVTNLLIIIAMVVVFVLALVLPFPQPHQPADRDQQERS